MIFLLIDSATAAIIAIAYATLEYVDRDRIEVDDDYLA